MSQQVNYREKNIAEKADVPRSSAATVVAWCLFVGGVVETYAQSSTLPSGWANRDIGGPTPQGSTRVSGGTWTVAGGGDNVWGTADEFHFAYRAMSGDVDISARVASFDTANEWSKAGVMIRDGLTANARNAFALLVPEAGAALQRRTATGGSTTRTDSGSGFAPGWVRLVRLGSRFTAYRSTDGRSWTTIASTTISMPVTVYVGLAVTSRDPASRQPSRSRTCRLRRHSRHRGGIAMWEVQRVPGARRLLLPDPSR